MSEDKKSLINLVPESIDNALKNLTDKPTQSIGTTLADIWNLVFGKISYVVEKQKLKYSYALQDFEKELKDKISKIPSDKEVEPDIQIVATALESSKYCIDKEELRKLFVNLITKSINKDFFKQVHPIFIDIISHLTPLDAKVLQYIYKYQEDFSIIIDVNNDIILFSLSTLEQQGLIQTNVRHQILRRFKFGEQSYDSEIEPFITKMNNEDRTIRIDITEVGKKFCQICIDD